MKKIRITALVIGILLLVFSIGMSAMGVYNTLFDPYSLGIVGGADFITIWTIFRARLFGRYLSIAVTGLLLIVASVVLLVVEKKRKK